jgi:hypothetical protein
MDGTGRKHRALYGVGGSNMEPALEFMHLRGSAKIPLLEKR